MAARLISRCRRTTRALLGLSALSVLGWPLAAVAQQPADVSQDVKPVAVLSVAGADRLMEDFAYVTRTAERAEVGTYLQLVSASFLEQFDGARPAGVLITIEADEPKGVGFLPVPEGDKLLALFREKLGADVDDLGSGIRKLEMGKGVYLKQQGPWLYFTDHPRHLNQLPSDPVAMLDGLQDQYDVALRFYVRNIPSGMKDVADYLFQSRVDADFAAQLSRDPDADEVLAEALRDKTKAWGSTLIRDSDQITLGWTIDGVTRRTYMDLRVQAREGSSLDRQFASLSGSESNFTGFFLPEAAAAFQSSLRVSDEAERQISWLIHYLRDKAMEGIDQDPQAPEALKPIISTTLDVVERTVREGKTDLGGTLRLAPRSFQFVGGVRVADGRALAQAFQELFELARHEPNVPEIDFYARKLGSLDLHTLRLPIAEQDKDARKLLGEHVDIAIATGAEQVYFALGEGSEQLLASIVERSRQRGPQSVPSAQLRVALKPVLAFLASIETGSEKRQTLAEAMDNTQGGDQIQLTVQHIDHGIGARLEVEDGVLQLLGRLSRGENSP